MIDSEPVDSARPTSGPALDGVTGFLGLRWRDPQTIELDVRPDLLNRGGLLSGVVTYALVDYSMGSALWVHTSDQESIATASISVNYLATAVEGTVTCISELDRRNRRTGMLRSEVHSDDGRLLVTAIGTYSIFPRRHLKRES